MTRLLNQYFHVFENKIQAYHRHVYHLLIYMITLKIFIYGVSSLSRSKHTSEHRPCGIEYLTLIMMAHTTEMQIYNTPEILGRYTTTKYTVQIELKLLKLGIEAEPQWIWNLPIL